MSLWRCPTHGLYGGDVFCPECGGGGEWVTVTEEPAQASNPGETTMPIDNLERAREFLAAEYRRAGNHGEAQLISTLPAGHPRLTQCEIGAALRAIAKALSQSQGTFADGVEAAAVCVEENWGLGPTIVPRMIRKLSQPPSPPQTEGEG